MNETRPFLITYHAMERYCERVYPALPLHQIRDLRTATNDAKIAMETAFPSALVLDVRTNDGHEQRRAERPYPCVFVCKEDAGAIVVSTVLGPNETILAEDEEIFEAYLRTVRGGIERGAIHNLSHRREKAGESSEEFVRRYVDEQIRVGLDPRVTRAAKSSMNAAVAAMRAIKKLAARDSDACHELDRLLVEFPLVAEIVEQRERIAS